MSITRKKLDSLGRETNKAEYNYKKDTPDDVSIKNLTKIQPDFDETQRHLLGLNINTEVLNYSSKEEEKNEQIKRAKIIENLSKIKDAPSEVLKPKKPWWKF